nr:MAG TPA: hypothetical protein [Caudoviricetes sp.]
MDIIEAIIILFVLFAAMGVIVVIFIPTFVALFIAAIKLFSVIISVFVIYLLLKGIYSWIK